MGFLGSTGRWAVVRGSLPQTDFAIHVYVARKCIQPAAECYRLRSRHRITNRASTTAIHAENPISQIEQKQNNDNEAVPYLVAARRFCHSAWRVGRGYNISGMTEKPCSDSLEAGSRGDGSG